MGNDAKSISGYQSFDFKNQKQNKHPIQTYLEPINSCKNQLDLSANRFQEFKPTQAVLLHKMIVPKKSKMASTVYNS